MMHNICKIYVYIVELHLEKLLLVEKEVSNGLGGQ